jgi:demethoxyubiquinone hydroxylase (CLK1/Coq7/Cat5 family)
LEEEKKIWGDFESNGEAVLVQDLRSDHAGETGAVYIYAGAQVRELGGRQTPSFVCDV